MDGKKFGVKTYSSILTDPDVNDWVDAGAVQMTVANIDLLNILAQQIIKADGMNVFMVPTTVLDSAAQSVCEVFGTTRVNLFEYWHLVDWTALITWRCA